MDLPHVTVRECLLYAGQVEQDAAAALCWGAVDAGAVSAGAWVELHQPGPVVFSPGGVHGGDAVAQVDVYVSHHPPQNILIVTVLRS